MERPTPKDLHRLDMRAATIVRAEPNAGARDPAICLWLDVGDVGVVQSSAKITDRYEPSDLVGRQVVVVAGLDPIRVGGFRSDVLVLGALNDGGVYLLSIDADVEPGTPIA